MGSMAQQIILEPSEARSIVKEFGETSQLYNRSNTSFLLPHTLPKACQFADLMADFTLAVEHYAYLIERDEKKINNYIDRVIKADDAS